MGNRPLTFDNKRGVITRPFETAAPSIRHIVRVNADAVGSGLISWVSRSADPYSPLFAFEKYVDVDWLGYDFRRVANHAYLESLWDALDQKADENTVIVTHSLGGLLVHSWLLRRPRTIKGLITLDTAWEGIPSIESLATGFYWENIPPLLRSRTLDTLHPMWLWKFINAQGVVPWLWTRTDSYVQTTRWTPTTDATQTMNFNSSIAGVKSRWEFLSDRLLLPKPSFNYTLMQEVRDHIGRRNSAHHVEIRLPTVLYPCPGTSEWIAGQGFRYPNERCGNVTGRYAPPLRTILGSGWSRTDNRK